VFMDVRMPPGLDGIETVERVWKNYADLEVVICTAFSDYGFEEINERLGVSQHLVFIKKPFEPVTVKQLALTLTTKWNLRDKLKGYVDTLEKEVASRTSELRSLVNKLTEANEEVSQSYTKLQEAQKSLVEASRLAALGEMAAGVAHEINNPLSIIHGLANQLKVEVGRIPMNQSKALEKSEKIEQTSMRIAKIVSGLRAFSRDATLDPFSHEPVAKIIQDVLSICKERFRVNDVDLRVGSIPENLTLHCSSVQIGQVLLNLLGNSYDAIQGRTEKWVSLEVNDSPDCVEFIVTDAGEGVAGAVTQRMFQPFFTTKEVGKGTGLGLSISKGIIEKHKGVLAYDEKSKNTCFKFSLPKKMAA